MLLYMYFYYRWLVVKDTFVAYIDPEKGTVRDVLLMDRIFKVYCGKDNTRIRHGLVLSNMNRLVPYHFINYDDWL